MMKVAFAGPASNLALAFIAGLIFKFSNVLSLSINQTLGTAIYFFLYINIALAVFNMIPVYPLDGSQIFGGLISRSHPDWDHKLRFYGPRLLLGVILIGIITGFSILGIVMSPFINFFLYIFAGI